MHIESIATMDREGLMDAILREEWGFPVDLTAEYLRSLNDEKLRHILVALCQQARRPTAVHSE